MARFHVLSAVMLVMLVTVISACGGGTGSSAEPTARRAGLPSPSHTGTVVEITARDKTFSRQDITLHAGEQTSIIFTNMDGVPHNISVYRNEGAIQEVFVGDTVTGPDKTLEYYFEAPRAGGEYFFRCDVHPTLMTGEVNVKR